MSGARQGWVNHPPYIWAAHGAMIALLAVLALVLPEYHHGNMARIMVLACFAMAYNLAFGYAGLLSLGHAMFFGAGVYAAGLGIQSLDLSAAAALALAPVAGGGLALVVGLLALRTAGVSFMIVTLMFAQACYLLTSYFGELTRADEGFVIPRAARQIAGIDLGDPAARYWVALLLFAACLFVCLGLVRSRTGRVMVAIRENEARTQMLGYDTFRAKLLVLMISGAMAGLAGGAYAILFGYVGATFASIQYSILPLLWVLLGGAGVVLGPFLGALLMFYLIDLTSSVTDAYLMVVGAVLVALVLYAPRGLLGLVRARWAGWLP